MAITSQSPLQIEMGGPLDASWCPLPLEELLLALSPMPSPVSYHGALLQHPAFQFPVLSCVPWLLCCISFSGSGQFWHLLPFPPSLCRT